MRRARRSPASWRRNAWVAIIATFALAITAVMACAKKPTVGANGVSSDDAIVYFASNLSDAQLYVDGRFVAPLLALKGGVAVDPGIHRFELRHDDYFSAYLELKLARAERKKVSLPLAQILP